MSRADDLKRMLAGERHKTESFAAYKRRRKLAAVSVKAALKGRQVYAAETTFRGKRVPYKREVPKAPSKRDEWRAR